MMAGKIDSGSVAALAEVGDVVGITNIYEGVTGRDAVTDRTLGIEEQSTRLGTGIGQVAVAVGAGVGPKLGRLGSSAGEAVSSSSAISKTTSTSLFTDVEIDTMLSEIKHGDLIQTGQPLNGEMSEVTFKGLSEFAGGELTGSQISNN